MAYYSEKEFLNQVSLTPLFKDFKNKPDKKLLKEMHFSEENYSPQGLVLLRDLLLARSENSKNSEKATTNDTGISKKLFKAYWSFTEKILPCYKLIGSGDRAGLSLLSILWLSPKFEKIILETRLKHKINPIEFKKKVYANFPKSEKLLVANEIENTRTHNQKEMIQSSRESFLGLMQKKLAIRYEIEKFVSENFLNLERDIAIIRNKYGLTPAYDVYLKEFVLFGKINSGDTLPIKDKRNYKEKPEVELNLSESQTALNYIKKNKSFGPHISINIFGSTSIESVYDYVQMVYGVHPELKNDKKIFLKHLPSYNFKKTIPSLSYEVITHKAMLYYFHDVQKLTSGEIVRLFKYLGRKATQATISRDIKSFKKIFHIES